MRKSNLTYKERLESAVKRLRSENNAAIRLIADMMNSTKLAVFKDETGDLDLTVGFVNPLTSAVETYKNRIQAHDKACIKIVCEILNLNGKPDENGNNIVTDAAMNEVERTAYIKGLSDIAMKSIREYDKLVFALPDRYRFDRTERREEYECI